MSGDEISSEDVELLVAAMLQADGKGSLLLMTYERLSRAVLAALAGRLLPPAVGEKSEWKITTLMGERHEVWEIAFTEEEAMRLLAQAKKQTGWTEPRAWKHTITRFDDGSVLTGPWLPVEEGTQT